MRLPTDPATVHATTQYSNNNEMSALSMTGRGKDASDVLKTMPLPEIVGGDARAKELGSVPGAAMKVRRGSISALDPVLKGLVAKRKNRWYQGVLEPGMMLVVPHDVYHYVNSLQEGLSFSYNWTSWAILQPDHLPTLLAYVFHATVLLPLLVTLSLWMRLFHARRVPAEVAAIPDDDAVDDTLDSDAVAGISSEALQKLADMPGYKISMLARRAKNAETAGERAEQQQLEEAAAKRRDSAGSSIRSRSGSVSTAPFSPRQYLRKGERRRSSVMLSATDAARLGIDSPSGRFTSPKPPAGIQVTPPPAASPDAKKKQ